MSVILKSGASSALANVDANNNLQVNLPTTQSQSGFATLQAESDSGAVTGSRSLVALEATSDYRLRVGTDTPLLFSSFEGFTAPQSVFQLGAASFISGVFGGYWALNSSSLTTANACFNVRSYAPFTYTGTAPLYGTFRLREANEDATFATSEWGFGTLASAASIVAPTDGVFFRRAPGGALQGVISYGGTELVTVLTTTNAVPGDGVGSYSPTERSTYLVVVGGAEVSFWVNNTLLATVPTPSTQVGPSLSSSLSAFCRVYSGVIVSSAARRVELGTVLVEQGDHNLNTPMSVLMAGQGAGSYQNQQGVAVGQTTNWTNSTAPANATLSNTAASYTTPDGQFQFVAHANNEVDHALFAYLNPAGTNALPGKTFYVTGVRIGEMVVTGLATANATSFFWACACGSTGVSLATVDGTGTVAPRRKALGSQSFLASAAVGTQSPGFFVPVDAMAVPPGCYWHIIIKQLNGAATASLVFRGTVTVIGFYR